VARMQLAVMQFMEDRPTVLSLVLPNAETVEMAVSLWPCRVLVVMWAMLCTTAWSSSTSMPNLATATAKKGHAKGDFNHSGASSTAVQLDDMRPEDRLHRDLSQESVHIKAHYAHALQHDDGTKQALVAGAELGIQPVHHHYPIESARRRRRATSDSRQASASNLSLAKLGTLTAVLLEESSVVHVMSEAEAKEFDKIDRSDDGDEGAEIFDELGSAFLASGANASSANHTPARDQPGTVDETGRFLEFKDKSLCKNGTDADLRRTFLIQVMVQFRQARMSVKCASSAHPVLLCALMFVFLIVLAAWFLLCGLLDKEVGSNQELEPQSGQTVDAAAAKVLRNSTPQMPRREDLFGNFQDSLVSLPPARPATQESPPVRTRTPGSQQRSNDEEERHLCPIMVVPTGMEFVFVVPEVLSQSRQRICFKILDLTGSPLAHVHVNEIGASNGIYVKLLDNRPLAWVRTDKVHDQAGFPEVCRASGEVYCRLARSEALPSAHSGAQADRTSERQYVLLNRNNDLILTFHGDMRTKVINAIDSTGQLICATQRVNMDDDTLHYQVRVAPQIDAGLLLCGLLALDKFEGNQHRV